jgi:hypothetical protein
LCWAASLTELLSITRLKVGAADRVPDHRTTRTIETANITLATTVTMLTVSSTESCQNRFGSKVMPLSLAVAGVEILIWIKMPAVIAGPHLFAIRIALLDIDHDGKPTDDAASCRANYQECKAQAALAANPSSKAQWLLFAQEWLVQAEAAEDQQRREAVSTVLPAK